jgi:hypothetical protein
MTKKSIQKISERLPVVFLVCISCLLAACNSGLIQRVELDPATHMVCDSTFNTPCGVLDTQPVTIRVWGQGKCDSVGVEMGNGTTLYSPSPFDFGGQGQSASVPLILTYNYAYAWPGIKTIHAYPNANCMGEARQTIQVMRKIGNTVRSDLNFTLAQPYSFANGITPGPCKLAFDLIQVNALRSNTKVTVTAKPDPNNKIDFGCLGGCSFGVDGEAGSSATAPFPFPGMAKHSLVLRVGTKTFQGGSQASFTTTNKAALEICVNDDNLQDNTGAWNFTISVDESQAQ